MTENIQSTPITYNQPSKQAARTKALTHAVELLTTRRTHCAILPEDYISRVISKMEDSNSHPNDQTAARICKLEDIESWQTFRASSIGNRNAADLTVAYLAGPEPTNDLEILINLGVRPENIWAFEVDAQVFSSALGDIEHSKLRGIKLMNVSIEDYFFSTPRRFDIIYFDACAPLPSYEKKTTQAIVNIFRHSALAPLGVLITNFSAPDTSKQDNLDNYGHLVSAYLYPKAFLDTFINPDHTHTDGAEAHGYVLGFTDEEDYNKEDDFVMRVKEDFINYYGSFLTRHIVDIASIVAPTIRLLSSSLHKEIVTDAIFASTRGKRFIAFASEELEESLGSLDEALGFPDSDGDAICAPSMYSLLYTLAACGLVGGDENFPSVSESTKKFCKRWANQLVGKPNTLPKDIDAIACFYALRHDKKLWATPLERLASFDYWNEMRSLCDIPTEELAFYPAFAQVAYPAHNNVEETRRYRYVAEGKQANMLLDVLPFDECRYVYDWLSTAPLIGSDWKDESRQLVFRFALDCIAKNIRWYQDDFLYGCHVVSIDGGYFEPPTYQLRKVIAESKKADSVSTGNQ